MTTMFATDDDRWAAVQEKNRQADGAFWLGVTSTGIFCRPVCPARNPLRKNVVFFSSLAEALRSGLRPCKRCRPLGESLDSERTQVVVQACQHLADVNVPSQVDDIATSLGMSPSHFQKVFLEVVGVTPAQFARSVRGVRLQEQLPLAASVTRAAGDAGYTSTAQFYADAPTTLGMTPGRFRNKGAGETIRYAIVETWLGLAVIAATERGLCRLRFGDDAEQMRDDVLSDFANATVLEADAAFEDLVQRTVAAIGTDTAASLPLDVRGTAFQARVWQELRRIPFGQTVSYGELANRIGQPTASRAVASACGSNPIAVLVPCHRVIAADGSLGGYHWGLERKVALLRREREG